MSSGPLFCLAGFSQLGSFTTNTVNATGALLGCYLVGEELHLRIGSPSHLRKATQRL
jgi:hypothetical protein